MRKENAGEVAFTITLIVLFCVLVPISIGLTYEHWDNEIAYRKTHPYPGWRTHVGHVVSVDQPNFHFNPPERRAEIQFRDYYGGETRASMMMPYVTRTGQSVQVDVHSLGKIYVQRSPDYRYDQRGHWSGPRAAAAGFWPAGAIVIWVLLSAGVALVLAALAAEAADYMVR